MKKIILVGYMGSGKTTIGKLLSEYIEIPFYDLDNLIENKEGNSVQNIFSEKGEIYFRKLESELFKDFVNTNDSFVLSIGGGTPCYANSHLILQNHSVDSFYLKNSIEALTGRLSKEKQHRPLISNLSDEDLQDFIRKHLFERNYFYFQSKNTIETENKSEIEIVKAIIESLA
jgi:shikimate kinase